MPEFCEIPGTLLAGTGIFYSAHAGDSCRATHPGADAIARRMAAEEPLCGRVVVRPNAEGRSFIEDFQPGHLS